MGWGRVVHRRAEQRERAFDRGVTFRQSIKDLDTRCGRFAFPPHFFDGYVERVSDPFAQTRGRDQIAELVVHSLEESNSISHGIFTRPNPLAVARVHVHLDGKEIDFGNYRFPIVVDKYDPSHRRIAVLTVLNPTLYTATY